MSIDSNAYSLDLGTGINCPLYQILVVWGPMCEQGRGSCLFFDGRYVSKRRTALYMGTVGDERL